MVFSSYVFLFLFFPALTVLYYLIPQNQRNARNTLLLCFSLLFYGWGGLKYLLLLLFSVALNWTGGFLMGYFRESSHTPHRKWILALVILCNCGLLGIFKYTDFAIYNYNLLFGKGLPLRNIVLPIGISFYTFQGMSYVIDVYKKPEICLKNPLGVALYITMFPQLVAGPIVRFSDVAEEIHCRKESLDDFISGLYRFVFGLAKKIILADTFGILADQSFSAGTLSVGMAWLGALAYTLQIYYDFSGYSDMAIGLGRVFGFHFSENFNYPYISASVTEFWRRWHISLSAWFRDYVYIPLGGSHCGRLRQFFNLAVVWLLTGLWHGASWNYVLWGLYYLICLCVEKYLLHSVLDRIPTLIRRFFTMLIVIFGWVLFRLNSMSVVFAYVRTMLGIGADGFGFYDLIINLSNYRMFWIFGILGASPVMKNLYTNFAAKHENSLLIRFAGHLYVFLLFLLCLVYIIASSYNAFIYFQF